MDNNETKKEIIQCLEEIGVFLDENEKEDVNICEYGMDSLGYIVFLCEVETRFGIEIPEEFLNYESVVSLEKLVNMVNQTMKKSPLLNI